MSIIKVVREDRQRFLISDPEIHRKRHISWEARGLHAFLMDKPEDWEIRVKNLINEGPAGKDKIRRMLQELEQEGYLEREQVRDPETGQFTTIATIYETVRLNPRHTPIYGGSQNGENHRGGFSDPAPGRVYRGGKPVSILNTDLLSIYKGDFRHFEFPGPNGAIELSDDSIQEMRSVISGTCKGYADWMKTEECDFWRAAVTLLSTGHTTQQVQDFREWWAKHGLYEGQPAIKSLLNNIDNMINGVEPTKKQGKSPELTKALRELSSWISGSPAKFSSPFTLAAIREVGEASLKSIDNNNRRTLMSQFETAFEKARQNGQTAAT